MNINILFLILSVCIILIYIFLLFYCFSGKKIEFYYNYKIRYDTKYEKHYKILHKQKLILFRKKLYLDALLILLGLRGVMKWK